MCLLVPADVIPAKDIYLQSLVRREDSDCYGNLLQIHFDGVTTQAKCDGTSTKSLTTSKSE